MTAEVVAIVSAMTIGVLIAVVAGLLRSAKGHTVTQNLVSDVQNQAEETKEEILGGLDEQNSTIDEALHSTTEAGPENNLAAILNFE